MTFSVTEVREPEFAISGTLKVGIGEYNLAIVFGWLYNNVAVRRHIFNV